MNEIKEAELTGLLMVVETAARAEPPRSRPPTKAMVITKVFRMVGFMMVVSLYALFFPLPILTIVQPCDSAAAKDIHAKQIPIATAFKNASKIFQESHPRTSCIGPWCVRPSRSRFSPVRCFCLIAHVPRTGSQGLAGFGA